MINYTLYGASGELDLEYRTARRACSCNLDGTHRASELSDSKTLQPLFLLCVCTCRNHGKEYHIMNNYRQLTRSTSNRMIAGVCAGLGEYLGIDPTIIRLLAVLAFFTGFSGIVIVYLVMALVVPEQTTTQQQ